jgi:hypothetical protein
MISNDRKKQLISEMNKIYESVHAVWGETLFGRGGKDSASFKMALDYQGYYKLKKELDQLTSKENENVD